MAPIPYYDWLAHHREGRPTKTAVILGYHRVAEVTFDPFRLAVSPAFFEEHMEIIQRHFRPLSLVSFVNALQDGNVPDRSVVVARLTPVVELREVHVRGACGIGCGQPQPPPLESAARLGVRQVSAIKFEEATYPYELLVETCDHPTPRP